MKKISIRYMVSCIIACLLQLHAWAQDNSSNKVAILPFEIVSNEPSLNTEEMAKKIQADCESSFGKNTSLQVQSSRTTNATLLKNNILLSKLDAAAPNELATMLGVQYVVFGRMELQNKGASTYGSSYSNDNSKTKKNDNNRSSNSNSYGSSSSVTTLEYQTHLNLEIFDNTGTKVYSENRSPFGSSADAYKSGLDYMIKRTAFGSKHKQK